MLYDVFIVSLMVIGITGVVWGSVQMNRALKEGKIRYIGKVRIERSTGMDKPK